MNKTFTKRNDLRADIDLADINNSAKLIRTITISKQFDLSLKYLNGLRAIIFKTASAVKIVVNTCQNKLKNKTA